MVKILAVTTLDSMPPPTGASQTSLGAANMKLPGKQTISVPLSDFESTSFLNFNHVQNRCALMNKRIAGIQVLCLFLVAMKLFQFLWNQQTMRLHRVLLSSDKIGGQSVNLKENHKKQKTAGMPGMTKSEISIKRCSFCACNKFL